MNLARRFLRERAEAGSRSQDAEGRKALGKLVYVSYVLFGAQQAAFLMPLRRVFSIQPASVEVMRRDNAKQLFNNYIKANGGELQVGARTDMLIALPHLAESLHADCPHMFCFFSFMTAVFVKPAAQVCRRHNRLCTFSQRPQMSTYSQTALSYFLFITACLP